MRIIDRYIITEFLKVFIVCVVGFTLVFLLGEIPDKIKLYFRYDPSPWMMARYFLVKTPGYLFFVQPLAILMGGMLSLSMLARNSEIIAMQANGIDALSIARPVLLIGAIGSALMFVSNETLIPWSNRTSEAIQRRIQGQDEQATVIKRNQIWIRGPHSMTHIGRYDERHAVLERVSIVKWTDAYKFTERVYADKAKWWGDHWLLYGVNLTRRADNGRFVVQALPTMHAAIDKPPSEFGRV
jgi:lipopolysaccharide export system permease protein